MALRRTMIYAQDAEVLGADEVAVSRDAKAIAVHAKNLDLIINIVAAPHEPPHELDVFMWLLKCGSTITLVGVRATPHPSPVALNPVGKRRAIAGAMIGGIPETESFTIVGGADSSGY